ncbi:hypothetical protein K435DRAFT_868580 [Dendrothele bispora CBS 962.96]|uniref:Family A G protein-coupled receptor-like protein n=1 Tax=Dendrothele bispora (strain CBS 962.96) TaxID=1314807 RepID=A0A4S8LBF7_DENBC|nr:hypothetical protein K435DRAFT_868580 [Dendrothele bispora CBS 962.96]
MQPPQTQSSLPLSDIDILSVKQWVSEIAPMSLLLGVQMTLSIMLLCIFVAQDIPLSKAKLALSLVTITMFLASLSSLVMNVKFIIIQIPLVGYNPPDLGEVISLITKLEIGVDSLNRLNYLMGDIIVVWRAWVLFPQKLPAKMALSICLMGSFVGVFMDLGLHVKDSMEDVYETNREEMEAIILTVPLILTNFTATTLIGSKAWYHFQNIRDNLGSTNGSSSKALKILLLLIESGLLYLGFWIGYLVLGLTQDSDSSIAQKVYLVGIMPELVAIYPVLVILAVAHESNKPENVNNMSLSQSIRFASAQASKSDSEVRESEGESQLAFPPDGVDNRAN